MERFDVHPVQLDPTRGSEIRKMRRCVIISPDEMNRHLRTVIVASLTRQGHAYPTRVPVRFAGTDGQVVLDRIRTVDKFRLSRRLGVLDESTARAIFDVLSEMFTA